MSNNISIYCDESSHLENDKSRIMGLGAVTCETEKKDLIFKQIRNLKIKYNLKKDFEIKWSKVSISKIDFYLELVELFFNEKYLGFRCIIIDKDQLSHSEYQSNHDEFYYKMNFLLVRELLHTDKKYKIYLDKKDTNGLKKINKLHSFLCNKNYDYKKEIVETVQEVVSHQIELIQLCDFLLGAVCYANKNLNSNIGKLKIIDFLKEKSNYSLTKKTLPYEHKFNILIWESKKKN